MDENNQYLFVDINKWENDMIGEVKQTARTQLTQVYQGSQHKNTDVRKGSEKGPRKS